MTRRSSLRPADERGAVRDSFVETAPSTPSGPRARAVRALLAPLVALVALAASGQARAIDYLVDVVLFEHVGAAEDLDGAPWFPRTGPALSLGSEEAVARGFEVIETNLSLEENARAIAASGRYRLLRHVAWRQPGLGADEAEAIRVNVGGTFELYLPDDLAPYEEFVPASSAPRPGRERAIRSTTLAGTLKVRLGRFLHMEALLVFTDTEAGRSYRLSESRKMRSTELHYIDNPRFGLLTRILPIEEDEPSDDAEGETAPSAENDAPADGAPPEGDAVPADELPATAPES